jgi:hypothetical protein
VERLEGIERRDPDGGDSSLCARMGIVDIAGIRYTSSHDRTLPPPASLPDRIRLFYGF